MVAILKYVIFALINIYHIKVYFQCKLTYDISINIETKPIRIMKQKGYCYEIELMDFFVYTTNFVLKIETCVQIKSEMVMIVAIRNGFTS